MHTATNGIIILVPLALAFSHCTSLCLTSKNFVAQVTHSPFHNLVSGIIQCTFHAFYGSQTKDGVWLYVHH